MSTLIVHPGAPLKAPLCGAWCAAVAPRALSCKIKGEYPQVSHARVLHPAVFGIKLTVAPSLCLQVDLLMQPAPKPKKTPVQRKHTRSVNSPWARGGAKKRARTEQWRKTKYPIQFVLLEHFLMDHNLTLESLHSYLVQHFDNEAHFEAHEDVWPEWEMASAFDPPANPVSGLAESEWEEVEIEDVEYDTAEGNDLPHRIPSSTTSSSLGTSKALPKDVEPVVGLSHTVEAPSCSHSAPLLIPPGEGAAKQEVHPFSELQAHKIREKDPRNPPRIPQLRFKDDPQSRIRQRDLDGLLQTATPRRVNEWQDAIRATTPDALPYTLFGLHHDNGPEGSQAHPVPFPLGRQHYRIASTGDDPDLPVLEADADYGTPLTSTQPRKDIFAFGPTLPPAEAACKIHNMRDPDYFRPEYGAQGGYRWALGLSSGSAGARVRQRFKSDGQWRPRTVSPSLEEITCFTEKRSLPPPVEVDVADIPLAITRGFPSGSLFRIQMAVDPPHMERFWHGSNLYCASSLYKQGPVNHKPSNGPTGVYCFTDARGTKVANYCLYILSCSGCAWSAFAQFAIPAIKTKKYATDQRYAQSQDITMTALWFHGVSQNQFLAEYIWPLWDPALEIYEAI